MVAITRNQSWTNDITSLKFLVMGEELRFSFPRVSIISTLIEILIKQKFYANIDVLSFELHIRLYATMNTSKFSFTTISSIKSLIDVI